MRILFHLLSSLTALWAASFAQDPEATPLWRSSFENGFPGEWLDYDNGAWSEDGSNSSQSATWTIVPSSDLSEGSVHGDYMYKGWINGSAASESHRAYPVLHSDFPTPLVNSWWVYLDTDYENFPTGGWHHFGTWGPNEDWQVHTMAVVGLGLEFAHVENPEFIGSREVPLREWFRFTVYIHYTSGDENIIHAWLNGEPILRASNVQPGGNNLMRSHWGLYASGNLDQGIQYNDDIQIWGLSEPWTDFEREPASPYDVLPVEPPRTSRVALTYRRAGDALEFTLPEVGTEGHVLKTPPLYIYDMAGNRVAQLKPYKRGEGVLRYRWEKKENFQSPAMYLVRPGRGGETIKAVF